MLYSSVMSTHRIVVFNWKMNPATVGKAKELFLDIRRAAARRANVETVVAAPFPYLAELRKLTTGKRTKLGAQDVFWERAGAHTGDVSASMLVSVGVSHVIVGHSERRARGETDEDVARKAAASIRAGIVPIVCVGEHERDPQGRYLAHVEMQVRAAASAVRSARQLIIAYEPVWAISSGDGKGRTAQPEDVHEMVIFIRRILSDVYSRRAAEHVPILYGGSVNESNAAALISEGMVDGFLVGGASLHARTASVILSAAHATRS